MAVDLYLNLLKKTLTDIIYADDHEMPTLEKDNPAFDYAKRLIGRDLPSYAHTMMGIERLDNLQYCAEHVLRDHVPGDWLEAGVWRGGGIIFMLALLQLFDVSDRLVWAADSFQGFPEPVLEIDQQGYHRHPLQILKVSRQKVEANIVKYGLPTHQLRFLEGWFSDTLPQAPITSLSILRIDGDLYQSTMDCLTYLYPKLEVGGYCIIDDYGSLKQCGEAVNDYRDRWQINETFEWIDWTGIYWRKE